MKITIEISEAQVKGIKAYLIAVSHDIKPKVGKKEIVQEIAGMVSAELQSGAVYDYIHNFENK